jgi:hypothetical protein
LYNELVRCLSCKYDLSHLAEHRCPECGREFDPSDPTTFIPKPPAKKKSETPWLQAGLIALGSVLFGFGAFWLKPWVDPWLPPLPIGLRLLLYPLVIAIGFYVVIRASRKNADKNQTS